MANMIRHVMRNFFNKPATRLYKVLEREPFDRTRGRIYFNGDSCIYCSLCQRKCPADAIEVDRGEKLWQLNAFRCIICGECVNACPKKCISISNERRHSAYNKKIIAVKKDINSEA